MIQSFEKVSEVMHPESPDMDDQVRIALISFCETALQKPQVVMDALEHFFEKPYMFTEDSNNLHITIKKLPIEKDQFDDYSIVAEIIRNPTVNRELGIDNSILDDLIEKDPVTQAVLKEDSSPEKTIKLRCLEAREAVRRLSDITSKQTAREASKQAS